MIGDYLKKFRNNDYASKGADDQKNGSSDDKKDEGHSRVISFTDDEKQMFQGTEAGSDLACEVHGQLDAEGKFRVMSIAPLSGGDGQGSEGQMANTVANRVTPTVQISPS